ncbi:hypothetical protein ACSV5N_01445 [Agrobacterium salinitolerans]|uniref:hypothetical protein n=1 Tax=Agrobacterium salinitolerans TaxID=1183413 RepID=UPI003FCF3515
MIYDTTCQYSRQEYFHHSAKKARGNHQLAGFLSLTDYCVVTLPTTMTWIGVGPFINVTSPETRDWAQAAAGLSFIAIVANEIAIIVRINFVYRSTISSPSKNQITIRDGG